jgi:hypothetical protein
MTFESLHKPNRFEIDPFKTLIDLSWEQSRVDYNLFFEIGNERFN